MQIQGLLMQLKIETLNLTMINVQSHVYNIEYVFLYPFTCHTLSWSAVGTDAVKFMS